VEEEERLTQAWEAEAERQRSALVVEAAHRR
jgi:hypothetical protein